MPQSSAKTTPAFDPGDALLFARVLDGEGGGREVSWDQARAWSPGVPGEVLWLHLDRKAQGVTGWLTNRMGIHPTTAELLVSDQTRPRAFREGDTLIATLRGINFNPGAQPEDMVSMQLWSDGKRVITLRRQPLQTPRDILADIDAGCGAVDAGALITLLTARMIARMNQSIVDMNDNIDLLEESAPGENVKDKLEKIGIIRRNSLGLKRHMGPQHDALDYISHEAPDWFEDHDRREIAETIERLRRYLDDLDISKESAIVLQDEIRALAVARSERTNYLLTIVAAIFLPLGFVTGLLGINVGGMPGVDDADAFWIVCWLCVGILAMQLALFWRWKWF